MPPKRTKRTKTSIPGEVSGERNLSVIRLPPLEISLPRIKRKKASPKTKKARTAVKKAVPKKAQKNPKKVRKPRRGGNQDA